MLQTTPVRHSSLKLANQFISMPHGIQSGSRGRQGDASIISHLPSNTVPHCTEITRLIRNVQGSCWKHAATSQHSKNKTLWYIYRRASCPFSRPKPISPNAWSLKEDFIDEQHEGAYGIRWCCGDNRPRTLSWSTWELVEAGTGRPRDNWWCGRCRATIDKHHRRQWLASSSKPRTPPPGRQR